MDPVSTLALSVVLAAAFLYALYWVIRRAVTAGVNDAERGRPHVDPADLSSVRDDHR